MSKPTLTIALPLPPRPLTANWTVGSHGSRMARYRATARYRRLAADAVESQQVAGWQAATAQATFYWPDKRHRDIRNAEYALKAAYDGLVDAGLIPDDSVNHLAHLPTRFQVDKETPRVEITLTEGIQHEKQD